MAVEIEICKGKIPAILEYASLYKHSIVLDANKFKKFQEILYLEKNLLDRNSLEKVIKEDVKNLCANC